MGNEPIYTVRLAGGVGNVMAGPPSSAPSRRSRGRRIVTSMKKRNLFAGNNGPRGLARPRPLGNRSRHPRPASGSANGIRSPGPNVRRRSSASEPLRLCLRLRTLRRWSDGKQDDEAVFTRSAGTRRWAGFRGEKDHSSRWATVASIAAKIGCTAQSLNEWVKRAEVDNGVRGGVPTEIAERLKALEGYEPRTPAGE